MTDSHRLGAFEWAVASAPLPGQTAIGDAALVKEDHGDFLVAAIDGLGHGEPAAAAAAVAAETIGANLSEPLDNLLVLCHQAMQATRGAAITLARVGRGGLLSWVGVGNVDGYLFRSTPRGVAPVDSPVLSGGIVGFNLPRVSVRTVELRRGDLIVLATDGIDRGFTDSVRLAMDVSEMGERLIATCAKGTDDALVLVSRFRGTDA